MKQYVFVLFILSHSYAWAQKGNPSGNIGGMPAFHAGGELRFGVGLSAGLLMTEKYSSVSIPSLSNSASVEFSHENGFGLELDLRQLPQKSWGFISDLSIESERKVTTGSVSPANNLVFITGDTPKVQMTTLAVSAGYRWIRFYIPFGVNYAVYNYKPRSTFSGSVKATGGVGAQTGFGYYILESVIAEIRGQMSPISHSLISNSGVVEDYGTGTITSIYFSVKYLF